MIVSQALREAAERLGETSHTARLDAELLMAHALEVSRSDMLLRHMDKPEPKSFSGLIDRRAGHEPVAYIMGHTEFYGREFSVSPDVLIPRDDSEAVIKAALEAQLQPKRVLDMGVGSGALLLTVLSECSEAKGVGIDRSSTAINMAIRNAQDLGLEGRLSLLQRDWTEPNWAENLDTFDLILCNPPYVETDAELERDVRDYEPAEALFAGGDGLDDYRILIPQIGCLLTDDGTAILEIGHSQGDAVSALARSHGFTVEIKHDLGNRPRCAVLCQGK